VSLAAANHLVAHLLTHSPLTHQPAHTFTDNTQTCSHIHRQHTSLLTHSQTTHKPAHTFTTNTSTCSHIHHQHINLLTHSPTTHQPTHTFTTNTSRHERACARMRYEMS
jgi:hypothetical protein